MPWAAPAPRSVHYINHENGAWEENGSKNKKPVLGLGGPRNGDWQKNRRPPQPFKTLGRYYALYRMGILSRLTSASGKNRSIPSKPVEKGEAAMSIPGDAHPAWLKAISGQGVYKLEFLATKLLLGRLNGAYKKDPSPAKVKEYIAELRAFFEKNSNLPKTQDDLKKIIEGR
jgi:hypothetical protein